MRRNLKAYKSVNVESSILSADPHKIVLMMYDGALENMAKAKGAIERKELALKSEFITKAISILSAMQNALDKDTQPAISDNFEFLYNYCIERLNDANINLNIESIDEVHTLIKPLRDAWKEMPEAAKQEGIDLIKERDQRQAQATG